MGAYNTSTTHRLDLENMDSIKNMILADYTFGSMEEKEGGILPRGDCALE